MALGAAPALARDAVTLLRQGERAERTSRYTGVKQIWACCSGAARQDPDYRRSVRIWHDGPGRTRLEFVREEGGPARVVVENGIHRWFYSPRLKQWRAVSWREPESRLNLLLKNYRVLPGPIDIVAGRRALQVDVEPRYPGNPRKRVWLDLATGIALRTDLYNSTGRLVSRSEFLQFAPERKLTPSLFTVPQPSGGMSAMARLGDGHRAWTVYSSTHERLSFPPALPRYLPRGYVLDRVVRTRAEGTELMRALFTDGLNTLALEMWRGPRTPEERGRERFWSPGDRIHWIAGTLNVTLSGDIGPTELRRVANSVRVPGAGSGAQITRK